MADPTSTHFLVRLRTLLSVIFAVLLMITAGFIGWIGYSSGHRALKHLTEHEFTLINESSATQIAAFLNDPANRLLDEFSLRARRGMLALNNDQALGLDLAERLRVNKDLAWISYSDAQTGHFVGVWRRDTNTIVLNCSTPGKGEAAEEVITPEGQQIPFQRPRPANYDPRLYSWFTGAMAEDETVWSRPYRFLEGDLGITASRSWKPVGSRMPMGVFTVDFYLRDMEKLLGRFADSLNGFSCVLEPDGKLLCASPDPNSAALSIALENWVEAHPAFKNISRATTTHLVPIDVGSIHYVAALDRVETPAGLKCIVASMIPETVIYGEIRQATEQMGLVSLVALILAVLAGWFLSFRISEPLRTLGNDLAKVGQFQLAPGETQTSVVLEVNQLRDAANRMKSGLRSFMRYVPDDLVRQLLSSGEEAVLGGKIRRLTVFFSDIEGFASHSETVTPDVLVHELANYFEILSRRLRQHSGTIDKFIGDGLLAFFNAPEEVPHHENLACRATLIGLQELALQQQERKAAAFRTRVGLHSGDVLVGNIGTAERFAYTVLGDVVNVASRLESLNKVYGSQILASGDVKNHSGDDFEWRHLDRVSVAGRKGSMDIFELLGLRGGLEEAPLHHRNLYEDALGLYLNKSFWDARRIFTQLTQTRPDDKAAQLMAIRCEHILNIELPEAWDGVFVYNLK